MCRFCAKVNSDKRPSPTCLTGHAATAPSPAIACGASAMVVPARLALVSLTVAFASSFHFGYLTFLLNPSYLAFYPFIHQSFGTHYGRWLVEEEYRLLWSCLSTVLPLGAIIGVLLVASLGDNLSRKRVMYMAVCLSLTGSTLSLLSQPCDSFELYIMGRFTSGISCSLSVAFQALYTSEIALKRHRSVLNGLTSVVAAIGGIVAAICAHPAVFGRPTWWPYLHIIDIVPSSILFLLPFLPESPNWLLKQDKLDEARSSISFFHKYAPVDVDYAIVEIRRKLAPSDQPVDFLKFWRTSTFRRSGTLGCLLGIASGCTGSYVLMLYASELITDCGFEPHSAANANVGVAFSSLLSSVVSTILVEKIARRPLILCGLLLTAFLNGAMMALLLLNKISPNSWIPFAFTGIAASLVFVSVAGAGQIASIVATELVPHRARDAAHNSAALCRHLVQFISGLTFYSIYGSIGSYSFLLFIIPLLLASVILFSALPETKGRSVDQDSWRTTF